MKKLAVLMALLAAFAITFVSTGCKNGEDGDNGTSAEALILRETGNKWYEYTGGSNTDKTPKSTTSGDLGKIYLKYNTASGKILMAAVGTNVYATNEKELTSGKWASTATTLKVLGKIKYCSSDPTSGKKLITDVSDWGDYTLEALITKLFE